ncbi:MAG: hypothetical protein ACRDJ9_15830, partial [Dehalococcoidia bacterium]
MRHIPHLLHAITRDLAAHPYLRACGLSAADYLTHWIAHAIRKPHWPLPCLMLDGPGREVLPNMLDWIVPGGVHHVTDCRMHSRLASALVCRADESILDDEQQRLSIRARITGLRITYRLGREYVTERNHTHWIVMRERRGPSLIPHSET